MPSIVVQGLYVKQKEFLKGRRDVVTGLTQTVTAALL